MSISSLSDDETLVPRFENELRDDAVDDEKENFQPRAIRSLEEIKEAIRDHTQAMRDAAKAADTEFCGLPEVAYIEKTWEKYEERVDKLDSQIEACCAANKHHRAKTYRVIVELMERLQKYAFL